MNDRWRPPVPRGAVELADLLAHAALDVAAAQEELDGIAERQLEDYEARPEDSLALPPLWYTVHDLELELELSPSVKGSLDPGRQEGRGQMMVQTLDPTSVGLYGYQASAGMRLRLRLGPQDLAGVLDDTASRKDPRG